MYDKTIHKNGKNLTPYAWSPDDDVSQERLIAFLEENNITLIQSHREKLLDFFNRHTFVKMHESFDRGWDLGYEQRGEV